MKRRSNPPSRPPGGKARSGPKAPRLAATAPPPATPTRAPHLAAPPTPRPNERRPEASAATVAPPAPPVAATSPAATSRSVAPTRPRFRRTGALRTVAAVVGAAVAGWVAHGLATPPPVPPPPVPTAALDSLDARLAGLRASLERLDPPRSDEEGALRRPATPGYADHLALADSLGVPPLRGEGDLARHVAAGRLVPLADTDRYVVRALEHSTPFATPATAAWLDAVGARFQARLAAAGLPPFRPVVSSALRTADLQASLRQTNRNAASGRSSHEHGVSVDFDYSDYRAPAVVPPLGLAATDGQGVLADRLVRRATDDLARAYWLPLFGELTRVLAEEQRADRALVLLEAEQPVFHVTVGTLRRDSPAAP